VKDIDERLLPPFLADDNITIFGIVRIGITAPSRDGTPRNE
jgi:hypothetical protein